MYSQYENFLKTMDSLANFKQNSNYTYVLEHVSKPQGEEYYNLLKDIYSDDVIQVFCNVNDSIGNPVRHLINRIVTSPTSLRYLYHAHLILKHFGNQPEVNIVEVGGGYGGLCLAIDYLSKYMNKNIHSYHIIDLDPAINLQKIYLKKYTLSFEVTFSSASDYGKELKRDDYCLISNYCFSEIEKHHQENYITCLFPKVSCGFLIWNHIPLYDFGKKVNVENEIPLTGPGNLFVFF